VIIPHDDKLHRGGEDAADSSDNILVVADGVGGWADRGVNPGIFSGYLTRYLVDQSQDDPAMEPKDLLIAAC